MKLDRKKVLRDLQCLFGRHVWTRATSAPAYLAGFNTRTCVHCPATQVYASELAAGSTTRVNLEITDLGETV